MDRRRMPKKSKSFRWLEDIRGCVYKEEEEGEGGKDDTRCTIWMDRYLHPTKRNVCDRKGGETPTRKMVLV